MNCDTIDQTESYAHPEYWVWTIVIQYGYLARCVSSCSLFPISFRLLSDIRQLIISMDQNNQADSPAASSVDEGESETPVVQASNVARTQHKLTKEEVAYLATRLPEYHALQATLAEKGEGPRGVKHIKGAKKAWVRAHIFEDFKKKFNSAAPGGPALDSVLSV